MQVVCNYFTVRAHVTVCSLFYSLTLLIYCVMTIRSIVIMLFVVLLTVTAAAAMMSSMYTGNGITFLYAGVFLCLAACCALLDDKLRK